MRISLSAIAPFKIRLSLDLPVQGKFRINQESHRQSQWHTMNYR